MPKKNEDRLHSADESGSATARRLISPANAWNVFQKCLKNDGPAAEKRALVQAMIDGNRPYDPSKLKALGQAWRSNVNFREAESIRDSNVTAYWSMFTEVPTLVTVKIRQKAGTVQPLEDFGQIVAEEYTDLMFEWPDFFFNTLLHVGEMLTFGMGPVGWTDQYDWRFHAFQHANVLIPANSRSSIGKLNIIFIRDTISPNDFFEKIEEEEVAKNLGWNVSFMRKVAVDRWIKDKDLGETRYSKSVWESFQQQMKNNDLFDDESDLDDLKIVHCFVRETKSGKISHYIIVDAEEKKEYLFSAENKFSSMAEVFCPFFLNIGDGYVKSIKGLGQKMYQSIDLSNRFINTIFDGSMLSASMLVGVSGGAKKDLRVMRMGPFTALPDGVQPIQSSFAPNIAQILQARAMLQAIMNNNYGVYQKEQERPMQAARTAREVMVAEQKETRLQNFQIAQYYEHLDRLHREVFRRLLNKNYPEGHPGSEERKLFISRCIDRGVPRELFDNPDRIRIRSTRAIGSGSPAIRQMIMDKMLGTSASFDTRGKVNVIRDWVAAYSGYEAADRYSPMQNRDQIMTSEHTLANLENSILSMGKPSIVGVDQPHAIHLDIHMAQLMNFVVQMQQTIASGRGVDPSAVLPYLEMAITHCREHLNLLAQDPRSKRRAQEIENALGAAETLMQQLQKEQMRNEAKRQEGMRAQADMIRNAQASEVGTEFQLKLAKIQADFQVQMASAKGKAQVNELKARHKMALDELRAQHKMAMMNEERRMTMEGRG